jgi:hypothetical protein
MSETSSLNRLLQLTYPALIFSALLLSWNTAGQANGFVNLSIPHFDPNLDPVVAQVSCVQKQPSFLEARSCEVSEAPEWQTLKEPNVNTAGLEQASARVSQPSNVERRNRI